MRVQLIVTGELEKLALASSLQRMFPTAEFLAPMRMDGFTSSRVSLVAASAPAPHSLPLVQKLAAAMIAEVEPGRRREQSPDMVILVDDLELVNADQPGVVVEAFMRAVNTRLNARDWTSQASRARAEQRLRERCSLHLLAPLVEAYFFEEPDALIRAGVKRVSSHSASADVEKFEVDDAVYNSPPNRHRYWATPDRRRHPKQYLDYLCTDPLDDLSQPDRTGRRYRETHNGRAALKTLDWQTVLNQQTSCRFARSLIDDIADALGVPRPPGDCAPETQRKTGTLLRNA